VAHQLGTARLCAIVRRMASNNGLQRTALRAAAEPER